MKRQKNIRLSERTWEKLEWLAERYGTQTTALEIAIDQLYEKEKNAMPTTITLYLNRDPDAYGEGATETTPDEYAQFAREYLRQRGYTGVEIIWYDGFLPRHLTDKKREEQQILANEIWNAYCAS